jgi:ABC-type transport system substrate-binding protein
LAVTGVEAWEASDDGKTYVFNLRKDATFHDGTPVTATAFDGAALVRIYASRLDPRMADPYILSGGSNGAAKDVKWSFDRVVP